MKRMTLVFAVMGLTVSLFSTANAGLGKGMGGGCDTCAQQGAAAPAEPIRKFQADTIDLRQEMMMKRFEAQRENLKGTPDMKKIAALQADIKLLQTKILTVRSQSGLPEGKRDGECVQIKGDCMIGMGNCFKSMGDCGKGMGDCTKGMGNGGKGMGDCNSAPCGMKK